MCTPTRPPVPYRLLLRLAGCLAPPASRARLRKWWGARLESLWVLVERGELSSNAREYSAEVARAAFADALWLRITREELLRLIRSPALPLSAMAVAALLAGLLTGGFPVTRQLVRQASGPSPAGSEAVPYGFAVMFTWICGLMVVAKSYRPPERSGWRYWLFLILKASAAFTVVPATWIEAGTWVRLRLHGLLLPLGAILSLAILIAAFGCALRWCFADQRRRCPGCLRLLTMPVTIGSWASVFEPATTELACGDGHGTLAMAESDPHGHDQWTVLDESWRELFASRVL